MQNIIKKINKKINLCLKNSINNNIIINLYLDIGKILSQQDISYQNWFEIEDGIRKEFGLMVCFSRKNLNQMVKLYMYSIDSIEKKYILTDIDWNTYLYIFRMKKWKEYILVALQNKLNRREMEYYVKTGKIKKINQNYIDPSFEELQELQNKLNKNK